MKLKPKILIICPFFSPNLGGVETHLDLLTSYLNKKKYCTTVLTYKPLTTKVSSYLHYEKHKNLKIYRYWWFGQNIFNKTTPYPFIQFIYIVPKLLISSLIFMLKNHKNIDVIHAHGFAAGFITRIIKIIFPNKKTIISTHFIYNNLSPNNLYSKLFKWVLKSFDTILLIGKESGKQLISLGLNSQKMKVFHHWLDQNKFKPLDKDLCRKKLKLPKAKLHIIFIGRIIKMKGIFKIVEAAKKLPSDINFMFLGDGEDFENLKQDSTGLKNIKLLGRKSRSEIVKYLGASDILILPSLEKEAQPYVIMEALTCGRPVITTNKGAIIEMYDSSVGITIAPTTQYIYKTIKELYDNPQKITNLSSNTRKYAQIHYNLNNAKDIVDSYL